MSIGVNSQINKPISFSQKEKTNEQRPKYQTQTKKTMADKILKPAVLLSSIAGVALVVSSIAKRQGVNILKENKFSDIIKPHKWKITDKGFEPLDIIKIAASSITGGLTAGLILDNDNKKAKLREAFQQIVGNIIIPVTFVTQGLKMYEKLNKKYKIENKLPEIKTSKKLTEIIKKSPPVIASMACLALGILSGNWIANKASQAIFNVNDKRKIEPGDLSGHIDDVCLAAILINPSSKIGSIAGNLIPVALLISGFESGTKKNPI